MSASSKTRPGKRKGKFVSAREFKKNLDDFLGNIENKHFLENNFLGDNEGNNNYHKMLTWTEKRSEIIQICLMMFHQTMPLFLMNRFPSFTSLSLRI